VDQLLTLSKFQAGQMVLNLTSMDFGTQIAAVQKMVEQLLIAKQLQLKVIMHTHNPRILADQYMLDQVITNLLSNAIKFSPTAGQIVLSLGDETILHAEGRSAPGLRLSISDQGVGVPENELERIFDKFVQSSKTNTGAGGAGLGLSICREIASAHGGRIWAENNSPSGTSFHLIIPRRPEQPVVPFGATVETTANEARQ
jgi:signal transduction histidine kinase